MDLPKFDGRTVLTKEAMNDVTGRTTASTKLTVAPGIDEYKIDGTQLIYNPQAGTAGAVIPDFVFVYAGNFGFNFSFYPVITEPNTIINNSQAIPDPGTGEPGVGYSSLPDGWPNSFTQPFTYHAPVFGNTATINDTPVSDEIMVLLPSVGVTGGSFKLQHDTDETSDLAWNVTGTDLQAALEGILGTGNVEVSSATFTPTSPQLTYMQPWSIRLKGTLAAEDGTLAVAVSSSSLTTADENVAGGLRTAVTNYGPMPSSLYQTITAPAAWLGGRFRIGLTNSGPWTDWLQMYASAEEIEAALDAIPALTGNVYLLKSGVTQAIKPVYMARDEAVQYYPGTGVVFHDLAVTWPWPTSLDPAPLNAVSIDSTNLVGGAVTWTVEQVSTRIPLYVDTTMYAWAYANIPLDQYQAWTNPVGYIGPWKYPCWYGKLDITGTPTSGTFTVSRGARSIVVPWAGSRTLSFATYAVFQLDFDSSPGVYNTGFFPTVLPTSDQVAEREFAYKSLTHPTPSPGVGFSFNIYFRKGAEAIGRVALAIDTSEVVAWNGSTVSAAPTAWTVQVNHSFSGHGILSPHQEGIVPLNVSTGLAPHEACAFLVWQSGPVKLSSSLFTHLDYHAEVSEDGEVPSFTPTQIPAFGDGAFTSYVFSGGLDQTGPPQRFVLCDSPGGYVQAPDFRLLKLVGFTPYRVRMAGNILVNGVGGRTVANYEYYNALIVEPRPVDRRIDGPHGTQQACALFDPAVRPQNVLTNIAQTAWQGISLANIIYPQSPVSINVIHDTIKVFGVPTSPCVSPESSPLQPHSDDSWGIGLRLSPEAILPYDYFIGIDHANAGFPQVAGLPAYLKEVGTVFNGLVYAPPRHPGFHNMEKVPPFPPYPIPNITVAYNVWPAQQGPPTSIAGFGFIAAQPILENDPWDESLTDLYCGDPGKVMTISGCVSGHWQATITTVRGNTQPLEGAYDLDDSTVLFTPGVNVLLGVNGVFLVEQDLQFYGPWTTWQGITEIPSIGAFIGIKLVPSFGDYHWNYNPAWRVLIYMFTTANPNFASDTSLDYPDEWGFPIAISEPVWPTEANTNPVNMTFTLAFNGALKTVDGSGNDINWWTGSTALPVGVIQVQIQETPVTTPWDFWLPGDANGDLSACWGTTSPAVHGRANNTGSGPLGEIRQPSPLPWLAQATMRPMTGVGCVPVKLRVSISEGTIPSSGLAVMGDILDINCQKIGPPTFSYNGPGNFMSSVGEYVLYCYGFLGRDFSITSQVFSPDIYLPYHPNLQGQRAWQAALAFSLANALSNLVGVSGSYQESFVLEVDSDGTGPTLILRYNYLASPTLPAEQIFTGTLGVTSLSPFQLNGHVDVYGDPASPSAGKASRLTVVVTM